jgi:hypothetical protein
MGIGDWAQSPIIIEENGKLNTKKTKNYLNK